MGNTHASQQKCDRCKGQGIDSELVLKNYTKPYKCDGCKEQGFGSRYRCEECDFELHKDCMFPSSTTCHRFFENSTFKFFNKPPCSNRNCGGCEGCEIYCDACTKRIYGFVYHFEGKEKNWDLHPCCLNLESEFEIDGVKFTLCGKVSKKCICCNKIRLRDCLTKENGWSYVSMCKKDHYHVYCVKEMVIKMVLKNWENGVNINDNNCLALENLELPIRRHRNRNGGRGKKCWRIVKPLLKTIPCILLGDPTLTVICFIFNMLTS